LVCEHGLATKRIGGDWEDGARLDSRAIDEIVLPIFEAFTERTPGSRIERKASSVAWHYRNCDPKFGVWRAKELRSLVENGLTGQPYTVLWGSRVLEVRHLQITKGHAATEILERHPEADFILCAGNDRTDEDMFEALSASGRGPRIVVHVGSVNTSAEFFVEDTDEIVAQLSVLAEQWGGPK
ncbi:MAG: trehalose-phosphatase, partial [Deltaproteobacteria bacterium]|nr:trehalose-phosphatase [Deltaproteobacteria bacterium]